MQQRQRRVFSGLLVSGLCVASLAASGPARHAIAQAFARAGAKLFIISRSADKVQLFKYVVKNVAWRAGKTATFMPKPLFGDNGSGMSPDFVRNRLFRPFNSTKVNGMGIGTYESFQYVKELGGSVDVQSTPGQGTVVTLLLPLLDLRMGSDLRMEEAS